MNGNKSINSAFSYEITDKISFEHHTEVEQRMALYVATLFTASTIGLSQMYDWTYAQ